jgi:proline iminopeptidase
MVFDLFPPLNPYENGYLVLDDLHEMYWEQSGNPHGFPVVFLHGGPGAGASPASRRFFDPRFYRIIVFDQRGCGRSKPLGEMRQNTTPLLVEDIETLKKFLKIDQWLVFGGSWGCTLALSYAEAYPRSCAGLILRGIFLCRPQEIDWFLYGTKHIFPDVWREFAEFIPLEERDDLLKAYCKRVMDPDPQVYKPACLQYSRYEGKLLTLLPDEATVQSFEDEVVAMGLARCEAYYFMNNIFQEPNQILNNIHRIQDIEGVIIQGRYDVVCPTITADELARAWPRADYIIVPDAGHSAFDPSLKHELIKATEGFKEKL